MSTTGPLRIGIYVFDDAEELDVVGPFEVLAQWATHSLLHPHIVTFSDDGGGVRLAHGMRMVPDTSREDVGPLHVLLYPGGPGTRAKLGDHAHLEWLRGVRATTPLLVSVCTGALVLAAAGLLAGRTATTHHGAIQQLARIDPAVLVDTEARFVDDGDLLTTAGISAGIDAALHLVARLDSVDAARTTRRALQYDPAPPV